MANRFLLATLMRKTSWIALTGWSFQEAEWQFKTRKFCADWCNTFDQNLRDVKREAK